MLTCNRNATEGARRFLRLSFLTITVLLAWNLSPALAQNNRSIKVMTQSMDGGTDLGAQLTYQEITTQSMIPQRAQRLADEIAAQKPDLISLQEVTTNAVFC